MDSRRKTLYDALGLDRSARSLEIARAHDRLMAEFDLDTTPPDPRRQALIREAFAVLSDPARRAEYDRTLDQPPPAPDRRTAIALGAGAAVAAGLVVAWLVAGRGPAPTVPARPLAELQAEAARSVGRVQAFETSGKPLATGVAFTVAQGVMATSCDGLAPGAQVVVRIGSREVPARIEATDESLGLCRLAVHGAGSWPLPGGPPPRAGAPIPIALAKKALQNYVRLDLIQALDHEQIAQEICRKTEDRVEGMKSFVEKREPVFKGK